MKRSVLVRNGRHMAPMFAVLERYGIGGEDPYGRGRWITPWDLWKIAAKMEKDPSKVMGGVDNKEVYVKGTCQHNHVRLADFRELWGELS